MAQITPQRPTRPRNDPLLVSALSLLNPLIPRSHPLPLANPSLFLSSAAAVVLPPDHSPPDHRLCCPLRCSRYAHPRYRCRQEIALMSPRFARSSTHRLAVPVRRRLRTRFRGSGQDRKNTMTMSPWPMSMYASSSQVII
uniref:Uncharacterized protein n=2 Tax=Oryza TaxID=4527 RepID=A0A0E0GBI5_ORYNI